MDLAQWVGVALFAAGLIGIFFEQRILMPKAAIALVLAFVLWSLRAFTSSADTQQEVIEAAAEVVGIFLFLFAAMFLIEVLRHYKFFDAIRQWLYARNFRDRQQFVVICVLTFFLSAVLDNLSTTLVMVTVAMLFFTGSNRFMAGAGIIVAANAGGAFSPIGDVTTIMLWVEGKFSASQVAFDTFLPSYGQFAVTTFLLSRLITADTLDSHEDTSIKLDRSEKTIIAMALGCFSLPLIATQMDLPPFMGILGGLGVVWIVVHHLKHRSSHETHLQADIGKFLKDIEYESLMFFAGILLAVNALNALGVLKSAADILLGSSPSTDRTVVVTVVLGILSAIVDNVPLTALAMDALPSRDPALWSLLAYTVGTGGSLLVVGSAAGIVAMGKIPEITSEGYAKRITLRAGLAFGVGVAIWYVQYNVIDGNAFAVAAYFAAVFALLTGLVFLATKGGVDSGHSEPERADTESGVFGGEPARRALT